MIDQNNRVGVSEHACHPCVRVALPAAVLRRTQEERTIGRDFARDDLAKAGKLHAFDVTFRAAITH